ncbi:dynamin family protein [Roseovarius phycicola]|uniref:Dynamin family protein n=1 Tax=Roseovarius phycicola TaxID=3080976 RepID=A0ABZ2HM14_9RHOB
MTAMTNMSETEAQSERKPRVALMGEFSAGKSTLLNMLLSQASLPVRITATSVPPVWIAYGEPAAARVTHDDVQEDLPVGEIADTSLEDTKYIRLWLKSDVLEFCDLFDLPGISDPNMDREVLMAVFDEVDSVIWCTHATQAWRQSEAATWEELSARTKGHNLLVITQFDKITSDRDRMRLLSRVGKETEGQFDAIFPLALLDATEAKDKDAWIQSGAAAFCEHLIDDLMKRELIEETQDALSEDNDGLAEIEPLEDPNRIIPKRVSRPKPKDGAARVRPPAGETGSEHSDLKNADA